MADRISGRVFGKYGAEPEQPIFGIANKSAKELQDIISKHMERLGKSVEPGKIPEGLYAAQNAIVNTEVASRYAAKCDIYQALLRMENALDYNSKVFGGLKRLGVHSSVVKLSGVEDDEAHARRLIIKAVSDEWDERCECHELPPERKPAGELPPLSKEQIESWWKQTEKAWGKPREQILEEFDKARRKEIERR